jgi:UDP-glucuronate 4-epimerase
LDEVKQYPFFKMSFICKTIGPFSTIISKREHNSCFKNGEFSMKTILITGAAGFIGSSLADDLLKQNYTVIGIDNFNDYYDPQIKRKNVELASKNPRYKLIESDICDVKEMHDLFKNNKIDEVVHLAARAGVRPSLEQPLLYEQTNCLGTDTILEEARQFGVKKLVLASSSSVYGNNKTVPFKETDDVSFAISPYAATKKANEVMAHVYHAVYKMNIIMLRFFTVYGPRQRPDLAINKFAKKISNGLPIDLYGDGKTYRDYTYISDIVNGIEKSLEYLDNNSNVYEIINLGSNNPITLNKMVETIEKELSKKAQINHLPMQPGDVNGTYANVEKAKKLLGYAPKVTFADGIHNFVEWQKNNN